MPLAHTTFRATLFAAATIAALPASAADFYAGKSVDLLIGAPPGGGYDIYGRVVGRHIGRHIPGNPTIVPKNMPGAGSARAAGFISTIAPKDGTVIANIMPGAVIGPLLDPKMEVLFDPTKVKYLGNVNNGVRVCISGKNSSIKTFDDALKPNSATFGGVSTNDSTRDYGYMHIKTSGAQYKMVSGYQGTADLSLALERGEIDGRTDTAASILQRPADWLQRFPAVVQNGPERSADLPDVPSVYDLNPKPGRLFETINNALSVDRPYVLSPGTPEERVQILRGAWAEMLKDKQLIAEAEKRRWRIVPTSYDRLEAFYRQAVRETPPDVLKQLKELFP